MKVAVTGANGFIGSRLVSALAAAGHEVVALSRRPPPATSPGIMPMTASLGMPLPAAACSGTTLVVHCAHTSSPGHYQANVDGTQAWFEQARAAGVERQVFLTSRSAGPQAVSEYGRAKFALETFFVTQGELALRLGLVVGDGGLFGRMAAFYARHPVVLVPGGYGLFVHLVPITGVEALVLNAMALPGGQVLPAFEPVPWSMMAVAAGIRRFYRRRGLQIPLAPNVTGLALRAGARLSPSLRSAAESFAALVKSQDSAFFLSSEDAAKASALLDSWMINSFAAKVEKREHSS